MGGRWTDDNGDDDDDGSDDDGDDDDSGDGDDGGKDEPDDATRYTTHKRIGQQRGKHCALSWNTAALPRL